MLRVKMKFRMRRFFRPESARLLLLGPALVACQGEAMATLGQAPSALGQVPPALVQAPAARPPMPSAPSVSGAKIQAAVRPASYTIHESGLDSGTTVREYATPSGVVFAVSWRGPVLPDLSVLLGDYFNAFREEAQQARLAGRRGAPVNMERDALVVRSNGRMRNFFGHAYAPDLIPGDVNIKDVLP